MDVGLRLGDIIDDHCSKCKLVTNHSVVSLVNDEPVKVRCRTCYHEHDYKHGKAPVKRDARKQALFKEVLASIPPGVPSPTAEVSQQADAEQGD